MVISPPQVLIAVRIACAPAIFVLACFGFGGGILAAILVAGLVSDLLDGVVARRVGMATAAIRYADTLADTLFYIGAGTALEAAVPGAFDDAEAALVTLVIVHVSRATFELTKYGRVAAYHMWSSKLLGVLLAAALAQGFLTDRTGPLLTVALWVGVANVIEGFVASAVLPSWRVDVPSVAHALRARARMA